MDEMEDDRYQRITLRLPKALHARLVEVADQKSRSMNAEIVARLEDSFGGAFDVVRLGKMIQDLHAAWAAQQEPASDG